MKRHARPPLPAALAAGFVLAGAGASADHELDLRVDLGYDSNVFDLNESVGERDGMFAFLEAGFSAEDASPSGWSMGLDAGATARLYEPNRNDGDQQRYFVRVRGDSGGKRREHSFDWALRYRLNDSTYVSRFTGAVSTDGAGNAIGDRFDNSMVDLRAAWHFPGGSYGRIALEASALTKNYLKDYAALGLERLDYSQLGLGPEYERGDKGNKLRIGLTLALREYRDRRASDSVGNPLGGTDLEYRYYGIDARYERALTRTTVLEWSGGYDLREDNGSGFGDRTRWNTGVEWTYQPGARSRLSVELEWSSRVFDRPVTGDPTIVDETPEKKGYRLDVRYSRPFPGVRTEGVSLLAETRWESFDNTDEARFSYDRLVGFAGIRKEF